MKLGWLFFICLSIFSVLLPASILSQAFQHEKIEIKGFDGNSLAIDSKDPYSPRRTCGACHDYEQITKGYHFQQGRTDGSGKIDIRDTFNPKYPWDLSSGMYGNIHRPPSMRVSWRRKSTDPLLKLTNPPSFLSGNVEFAIREEDPPNMIATATFTTMKKRRNGVMSYPASIPFSTEIILLTAWAIPMMDLLGTKAG